MDETARLLLKQAVRLQRVGDLSAARARWEAAVRVAPSDPVVIYTAGVLARASEDQERARALFAQALTRAGSGAEAVSPLQAIISVFPGEFHPRFRLSGILHRLGRYEAARDLLRELIPGHPGLADLHNNLGVSLLALGQFQEAADSFREATRLQPGMARAHANLGVALDHLGMKVAGLRHLLTATELEPDNLALRIYLARALLESGHLDTAERTFATVRAARPDDPDATAGLAAIAERRGDHAGAYRLMAGAVASGATDPNLARTWGLVCLRLGRAEEGLGPVEAALAADPAPLVRPLLQHTRAQLHHALKQHAAAFEAWTAANAAEPAPYDPDAHDREVAALERVFTVEALAAAPRAAEPLGERVVLIVGMPRSGTTLVESILGAHSATQACGEREDLRLTVTTLETHLRGRAWPEAFAALTPQLTTELGRLYRSRLDPEAIGHVLIDKMPPNYLWLGMAASILPGVRVVHCRRDPLDTCFSCFTQHFNAGSAWSTRLGWLGHRYRAYQRVMAHWERAPPAPILTIDYESLVQNVDEQARRLVAFCRLPWEPGCARPWESEVDSGSASYDQVRRPIYTSSIGRAAPYRAWLGPLIAALGADSGERSD